MDRKREFAYCEGLFRDMAGSTDADYVKLKRTEIWEKLFSLYRPCFYHLPTLQSLISAVGNETALDCYVDAIAEVQEKYDPDKGPLYPYLLSAFQHRLQGAVREPYDQRLYITGYPVSVYAEANLRSAVLRELTEENHRNRDASMKVYNVREIDGVKWYRIMHQYEGKRITGYIPSSAPVWLMDATHMESLEQTNEEGESEERRDIPQDREAGDSPFLQEENDYSRVENVWLLSLVESYLRNKGKSEGKEGEFGKYMSYHMLYTEYLVLILHEYNALPRIDKERQIMEKADTEWMDYFMEEQCRSFEKILMTRRRSYDHFDHGGNPEEIDLPAYIHARAPFLQDKRRIQRDRKGIEQSFSRHKAQYNELLGKLIREKQTEQGE
ncbi:MAG: hypothetical protein Q4Q25_03470 [Methanocorpusculum sp.]|nr:hypothetical protein [Methanocorpusculum sp.]